jgi:Leucine-rich repeat (LRR) protein
LSNNTLHGFIPTFQNCSTLQKLWLNGNNVVGGFSGLPLGLKHLEFGSNNLSGTIPPSLANITTLEWLHFSLNNIEGNFPDEFARFPELQALGASGNHFVRQFSTSHP